LYSVFLQFTAVSFLPASLVTALTVRRKQQQQQLRDTRVELPQVLEYLRVYEYYRNSKLFE